MGSLWVARNDRNNHADQSYVVCFNKPVKSVTEVDGRTEIQWQDGGYGRNDGIPYIKHHRPKDFEKSVGIFLMPGQGPHQIKVPNYISGSRTVHNIEEQRRHDEAEAAEKSGSEADKTKDGETIIRPDTEQDAGQPG